jgi:cob(I)alamin adenosyltransferase
MPYLNRLADLLWVLARLAEQAQGAPTTRTREAR